MRRFFLILLIASFVLTATALAACNLCPVEDSNEPEGHVHTYVDKVVAPTCSTYGYTEHSCSECGYAMRDTLVDPVSSAHRYSDWETILEPTCEDNGTESRECSLCGYIDTRSIDAEHTWGEGVETEPTCEAAGYITYTCTVCDATKTEDGKAILPHNFGEWKTNKEASCSEVGEREHTCADCSYVETEEIEMLEHSWDEGVITDPTCEADGYITYTCSDCKTTRVEDGDPALGHTLDEWKVTKESSCTELGTEERKCENCDYSETRDIEMHKYVETVIDPGCTTYGYTEHKCSECGDVYYTDYVNPLGHNYNDEDWQDSKDVPGKESAKCTECDHVEFRDKED